MLKSCFSPINYANPNNKACGEIICENENEFIINCKLCKLKIFEFQEFIQHFKNVHLFESREKHGSKLKCELYDERNHKVEITELNEKASHYIKNGSDENECDEYLWKTETNEYMDNDNYDNTGSDESQEENEENNIIMQKFRKPKELACEICEKKYADSRRLQLHVTLAHLKGKPFKCSTCDMGFAEEKLLQRHMKCKHIGYECLKCQKKFRSNQSLKRHTLIHLDIKNFVCDAEKCGKAFTTKGQLTKHKLLHSTEMFICEECGYKCRKRESLVVHKRHHTGEKPFGCNLCNSRFGSKSLLCEHMASHETERKHVCDVCGKSFNRPKALYHHKHLHLGVKKFVCKICGQAYAQASGLSAHTRKHREDVASFIANSPLNNVVKINNMQP